MGTLCRGRRSYENSPCWEDRARGTPRSVSPRCGSPREHAQDPHPGRRPYKSSLCLGSVCDHSPTAGCSVGCSEAALGGCAHWGPFRTGSGAVQHSMCYVRKHPCARLCAVRCSACMFLCRSCMCNAVSTRSGTQLLATCVCVSACVCACVCRCTALQPVPVCQQGSLQQCAHVHLHAALHVCKAVWCMNGARARRQGRACLHTQCSQPELAHRAMPWPQLPCCPRGTGNAGAKLLRAGWDINRGLCTAALLRWAHHNQIKGPISAIVPGGIYPGRGRGGDVDTTRPTRGPVLMALPTRRRQRVGQPG